VAIGLVEQLADAQRQPWCLAAGEALVPVKAEAHQAYAGI